MPIRLRYAESKMLPLRMAANSIELARSARIRNPEQHRLYYLRQRAIAEDTAKRPFDRRPDLYKSKDEREAMNRAYVALMARFCFENAAFRKRASRHFESWIARHAGPHMDARDICKLCTEAGALEP